MNITLLGQGYEATSKNSVGNQLIKLLADKNFHSYSVTEEELWFLEEIHDWICKKKLKNIFQME